MSWTTNGARRPLRTWPRGCWQRSRRSRGRPGPASASQPCYASPDSLTPVCNALAAAHVTGVGLWVADWNDTPDAAVAALQASSGPYPVIGVQYARRRAATTVTCSSRRWVNTRSAKAKPAAPAPAKPAVPPGQWLDPAAWTWAEATITGTGLDGKVHTFAYSKAANVWAKVL